MAGLPASPVVMVCFLIKGAIEDMGGSRYLGGFRQYLFKKSGCLD
jgi:hypothetical protein